MKLIYYVSDEKICFFKIEIKWQFEIKHALDV